MSRGTAVRKLSVQWIQTAVEQRWKPFIWFQKRLKKPINMLMVDQSYFIFTWKSLIPLLEQVWLAPRQWMEHSWRGNPRKGTATSPKSSALWALQHFSFFPKSPGPWNQKLRSMAQMYWIAAWMAPDFLWDLVAISILPWKHVARWLLCWIPVWPADPLNV